VYKAPAGGGAAMPPFSEVSFATGNANKLREVGAGHTPRGAAARAAPAAAPRKRLRWSAGRSRACDVRGERRAPGGPRPGRLRAASGRRARQVVAILEASHLLPFRFERAARAQVVAILEAGHPLPFRIKAANLDLPELQGEPEAIALEKCRLAAQQARARARGGPAAWPPVARSRGLTRSRCDKAVSIGARCSWSLQKIRHMGCAVCSTGHELRAGLECLLAVYTYLGRGTISYQAAPAAPGVE